MMRSGRCRKAAATSWLGVTATWPGICRDRLPANGIGMGNLQLGWLLDHDQPLTERNMIEQRLHQRGLSRAGSTGDDAVLPSLDQLHNRIPNMSGQAASLDQFIRGKPAVEFAHGKGRPVDRRRRADNGHARAIGQARIEDRILRRQVLPKDARDALNGGLQAFVRERLRESDLLDDAIAVCKDSARPIDHQIGDRWIEQKLAQLLGKERQNQVEAHRAAPAAASGLCTSTETRFSWNSVMVNPSGLMNSYCG